MVVQCFNCQRYGHETVGCTWSARCRWCAARHSSKWCEKKEANKSVNHNASVWKCVNCFRAHASTSPKCDAPEAIKERKRAHGEEETMWLGRNAAKLIRKARNTGEANGKAGTGKSPICVSSDDERDKAGSDSDLPTDAESSGSDDSNDGYGDDWDVAQKRVIKNGGSKDEESDFERFQEVSEVWESDAEDDSVSPRSSPTTTGSARARGKKRAGSTPSQPAAKRARRGNTSAKTPVANAVSALLTSHQPITY